MIVYLDGLERSGNVFLSYVVGESLDVELKSLRTHTVDVLRGYSDSNPFIVPVRDALPSITSAKIFRDYVHKNRLFNDNNDHESNIDTIILRYKEYIKYLVDSQQFFIAPFHCFTQDHNDTVDKIVRFYKDCDLKVINRYTKEEILSNLEKDKSEFGEYAFHPQLGNFPRETSQEKMNVDLMLRDRYSKDIDAIQSNIDILYSRYYSI
jgi:hypothetical protein